MDNLKSRSKQKLKETLNVSDKLFMETIEMMEEWTVERTSRSGAAVFSYSGDVYAGLESALWNKEDMDYANNHLFILYGLYMEFSDVRIIYPLTDLRWLPNSILTARKVCTRSGKKE